MRLTNAKDVILEAASIFFYERGYSETSLTDIAQRCNITKQAILYHFGSKTDLGMAASNLFEQRQRDGFTRIAKRRGGETDPILVAAAHSLWSPIFFRSDVNAARFYKEYISNSEIFVHIGFSQQSRFLLGSPQGVDVNSDEAKLERIRAVFAGKGLLDCFLDNLLDYSTEEFARIFLCNYYQAFCSRDELEQLYQRARALVERMQIKILPYYKVC
jgi:AcrR family transcriptional regulator